MKLTKRCWQIIIFIILILLLVLIVWRGTSNFASIFEVNAELLFNLIINFLIGLIIAYFSFEAGEKSVRENIKAKKAETENINKIIHQLSKKEMKPIFSTESKKQYSSFSLEKKDKIQNFLSKITSDFNELQKNSNMKKVKNNRYSYRMSSNEQIIFSKEGEIVVIHEIIKR